MRIAVIVGKRELETEPRLEELMETLRARGNELSLLDEGQWPDEGTEMILSVGGDGTFLSASSVAARCDIPVLGVNLGRLGFLSENRPEDVGTALLNNDYSIEERSILSASVSGTSVSDTDFWPYAFNEFTLYRSGAAMLGVDVTIDGIKLPTYWADGMIVSTSSGSTAYSLSAGGPIALPESKVLIITPIAPHNLNIRPLVVPDSAKVTLKVQSRDDRVTLTADNRSVEVDDTVEIDIELAQFSLRRIRLRRSDFINALTEKLHWGEDVRNIK